MIVWRWLSMAKIHISKSEKTIKKEEMQNKVKALKTKKNVTNEELKDLMLMILDKLE